MKLLALLTIAVSLQAAKSVQVTSSCLPTCPTVTLPNSAPFTTMGTSNWQITLRVENISTATKINLGEFQLYVNSGSLQITQSLNPPVTDLLVSTSSLIPCCTGRSDVMIKLQRDYTNRIVTMQMCNTAGGSCSIATWSISIPGQASWSGFNIQLQDSTTKYSWLRWFNTLSATSLVIRNAGTSPQVADWEFESNLTDSVAANNFSTAGGVTVAYTDTGTFVPSCDNGIQQTFRVGVMGNLDGSNSQPLDNGSTLNAAWSYAGIGSDLITQTGLVFGSASSLTSTLRGYIKGSVNLTLTLTDGSLNTNTCTIHNGAVNTNNNDVVSTGLGTKFDFILGKLLRYGSPNLRAPRFDYWNKLSADLQGAAMDTNFPIYWNTHAIGTVDLSTNMTCGGSAMGKGLVGHGTTFTSTFTVGDYIVLHWNSDVNRRLNNVVTIISDTCMILNYAWDGGTTNPGEFYTKPDNTIVGNWAFSQVGTPGNYYDNVKAYRSFYERSGIDTYWTYYITLADRFWAMPANDRGLSYVSATQSQYKFANRSMGLEGMMLRALDSGMSSMWAGIRNNINLMIAQFNAFSGGGMSNYDQREFGAYPLEFFALASFCDPDQTMGGAGDIARAAVSAFLPFMTAGRATDLSFPSGGYTKVNQTNTVDVHNGSTTVVCSTCDWNNYYGTGNPAFQPNNPYFVTYANYPTYPPTNAQFRPTVYTATLVDTHTITLNKPYVEASGTVGWATGSNQDSTNPYPVIGWTNQGFMEAIQAVAQFKGATSIATSDPTNATLSNTYGQGLATWLKTIAYNDPALMGIGGLYYWNTSLTCAYPINTAACNSGNDAGQARYLAAEATRAIGEAYIQAPTAGLLAFGNTLFDQMFCKPGAGGTCTTDGFYINGLDDAGGFISNSVGNNKTLGFLFGWSNATNWAAISADAAGSTTYSGSDMIGNMSIFGPVKKF